ncbi:MAG: hypothetical protein R3F19_32740 [Verrucomicrobiales bacterium]
MHIFAAVLLVLAGSSARADSSAVPTLVDIQRPERKSPHRWGRFTECGGKDGVEPIAIGVQSIRDAAEKVGSTLGIAVNESTGATTLSWDSFSVAATTDSAYVHPAYRVQISTDLEIWTNTGTPASLQILSDATSSRTVTIPSTNQKTGAGSEDTYYRIVLTSP